MKLTDDLKDSRLILLKGFLFLVTGGLAAAVLLLEQPRLRTALLLGVAIWSFCRFYYFAFYVIEKYVDPGYKFAGLYAFGLYLLRRHRSAAADAQAVPNAREEQEPR